MQGLNKITTEEVNQYLQGSAGRLIAHYVEMTGNEFARLIQTRFDDALRATDVAQALWARALLIRADSILKELSVALGKQSTGHYSFCVLPYFFCFSYGIAHVYFDEFSGVPPPPGLSGGRRGDRTDLSRQGNLHECKFMDMFWHIYIRTSMELFITH